MTDSTAQKRPQTWAKTEQHQHIVAVPRPPDQHEKNALALNLFLNGYAKPICKDWATKRIREIGRKAKIVAFVLVRIRLGILSRHDI